MNIKLLRSRQSFVYAWAGQGEKAMGYASAAQNAFDEIVTLTNKYNTGIAGGKWNGMMSYKPNNWSQHLMPAVATADDVAGQEPFGRSTCRLTRLPAQRPMPNTPCP